jgi:hypothetical protein
MEGVLRNISNVIVYIDDLLVHTQNHEDHLKVLDQVLARLHTNNLKINLDKSFLATKKCPTSVLPSLLKVSNQVKINSKRSKMLNHPQMSKQSVLLWVCAIFQDTHQNFAIIAAPLFRLTRKDSGYKGGPLPKEAMDAFCILKNSLVPGPVMAFPRADRQYALITDAATGTADTGGGFGTILT